MDSGKAEAQAAAVVDSLRWIVRGLRATAHSVERDLGVSGAQLFVLLELAEGAPLSIREVSDRTLTDPSSVSVVVARLVERGWVSRRPDPLDGRRTVLSLTLQGRRLVAKAPEPFQQQLVKVLRGLPPARLKRMSADLTDVLRRLGTPSGAPPMFFDDEVKGRARRGA